MFGHQPFLLFLFLVTTLWSALCNGAPAAPTTIKYVYRGDSRSPEAIKDAGGFLPKGVDEFGSEGFRASNFVHAIWHAAPEISLFKHVSGAPFNRSIDEGGYVFTTTSATVAQQIVQRSPTGSGYVYKIRVAENMIDVVGTLGKHDPRPAEKEYAALGGVKFDQVVSWRQFNATQVLDNAAQVVNTDFVDVPNAVAGGVQYQLAGFPVGHQAWNENLYKQYKACADDTTANSQLLGRASVC